MATSAGRASSTTVSRPDAWADPLVLTLLPAAYAARVAIALGGGARLHRLAGCADLRRARARLPDAVVVDPLECTPAADAEGALRELAASTALVVYTSVTPAAMRRLIELPTLLGARLVLYGVDDGPDALRATFRSIRLSGHHRRALEELESRAGPLPPDVARGLAVLFAGGARITVRELARAAHLSLRTLQRRLAESGAPSPVSLIRTARALVARELLSGSPLTVEEVAHQVGYSKQHTLRALLRTSFDASPSALRKR